MTMQHWNDGWTSWWWMPVGMLLAWVLVAVVIIVIVRAFSRPRADRDPAAVLDERYARGEISTDEYRQRRTTLRELHGP